MEYQQLMATIRIPFEGTEYTLSNIGPLAQSADRSIRRAVAIAIDNSMGAHQEATRQHLPSTRPDSPRDGSKWAETITRASAMT